MFVFGNCVNGIFVFEFLNADNDFGFCDLGFENTSLWGDNVFKNDASESLYFKFKIKNDKLCV